MALHIKRFTLIPAMVCTLALLSLVSCGRDVTYLQPSQLPAVSPPIFNVKSFGAKGDGITDDAAAIETTMQAAVAAGGGQVIFPCGEFAVKSLQGGAPAGRSALYLEGASNMQLVGQGPCTHVFTVMPQKSLFEFAKGQSIAVSQMHLTALNAIYVETFGMDGGSVVRFTGVTYGSITSLDVDGASAGALYLTGGTSHISVTNNSLHDLYGAAIWEDDCGGSNASNCAPSLPPSYNVYADNTVTDTAFYMYAAISVDDGNGTSNALIQNNVVTWTKLPALGTGQNACVAVNNASNVTVLNNTCTNAPWDGMIVTTGVGGKDTNITLRGNTIAQPGRGAIAGNGVTVYNGPAGEGITNFTLVANTMSDGSANGIQLNDASDAGAITGGTLVNNTITMMDLRNPGTSYGIDVEYSGTIEIHGNAIQCNGTCIAAGVNVSHALDTLPTTTDNSVVNILGQPLRIQ